MGWIIDLVLILLVLLMVFIGVRRGFVRTVIQFVGYFIVLALALSLSSLLSNVFYTSFIRPSLVSGVEKQISNVALENVDNNLENVIENLPDIIKKYAESFEVDFTQLEDDVKGTVNNGSTQVAELIIDTIAKKIILNFISMILVSVIFVILIIPMKLVAKSVDKIFKSTAVVGTLNGVLGGTLGMLQAVLFILLAASIAGMIVQITGGGVGIFKEEIIEKSMIFSFFYKIRPVRF